ncbi:MAG: glycosyltransferase, partial [Actinomycetota bacterium]|nr:glycosyltransferase [Actinomycetota bacterium]
VTPFDIVTVTHNSAHEVTKLLQSVTDHAPHAHVIVVDAASTDDSAERAREWAAEVIELGDNPGFGAANNVGVEHAKHDVTALLNPDVELLDDGLTRLADRARRTPDALLAPRLLNQDGTIQDSAHPTPGTRGEVLRALFPPARAKPWRATQRTTVGWAVAAALVGRTELLRRLGPFDPDAFLWYEDMDLCLRAQAVELHPDVALRHTGGHSTTDDFEARARRRREVVEARLGTRARRRDDLAQGITFAAAATAKPRARAQLRALLRARG